ncbi:MAG: hypothetical protein ACRDTP_05815 [Mycobacteriales bacterium]
MSSATVDVLRMAAVAGQVRAVARMAPHDRRHTRGRRAARTALTH